MENQKQESDLWYSPVKKVCRSVWSRVENDLAKDADEYVSDGIKKENNQDQEYGIFAKDKDEYIMMDLLRRKVLNRLGAGRYFDTIDPFGDLRIENLRNISNDSWEMSIQGICAIIWKEIGEGCKMSICELICEEIIEGEYEVEEELEEIKQNEPGIKEYWEGIIRFEDIMNWSTEEKRYLVNEEEYMMKDMLRRKVLHRLGTFAYFDTIDPCGGLKKYLNQ